MSKRITRMITAIAIIPLLLTGSSVYANEVKPEMTTIQTKSDTTKLQLAKGQNNLPQQKGKEKSSCS